MWVPIGMSRSVHPRLTFLSSLAIWLIGSLGWHLNPHARAHALDRSNGQCSAMELSYSACREQAKAYARSGEPRSVVDPCESSEFERLRKARTCILHRKPTCSCLREPDHLNWGPFGRKLLSIVKKV